MCVPPYVLQPFSRNKSCPLNSASCPRSRGNMHSRERITCTYAIYEIHCHREQWLSSTWHLERKSAQSSRATGNTIMIRAYKRSYVKRNNPDGLLRLELHTFTQLEANKLIFRLNYGSFQRILLNHNTYPYKIISSSPQTRKLPIR